MALPSNFRVSEAIDEAFERDGFKPEGITPEHLKSARRSIRLMLDTWCSDSVTFWKVLPGQQHTTTIGESSFVPPAGCLDLLNAALLRSQSQTPMLMISREDWFNIPDRLLSKGMPNRLYVERDSVPPTANYYPYAENASDIIVYDAWMQFNDSTQLSGSADIPPRWNEAFTAGLAAYLADKFARDLSATRWRQYGGPMFCSPPNTIKSAYEIARAGDRERADTVMVMSRSRRPRR